MKKYVVVETAMTEQFGRAHVRVVKAYSKKEDAFQKMEQVFKEALSFRSDRPAGTYPGYCHMEDAVLGWDEREKLVEFARGMRDEACNLACQLISSKTKELTGKTTDEISVSEFVRAISMDNPTSYVIADGFRILDNAPNLNCGALFLNEYDIWKVFPSSEELNDVINNAEQYILVDIDFKV